MTSGTTPVDELPYQWNSEVFNINTVVKSEVPRDAHHLNLVLAVDALSARKVTLPLLKKEPFYNLSMQEISQIRDCAYNARVYSVPCLDPTAIQTECLHELQQLTKQRLSHSSSLHFSCFRSLILMSAVAPDVVINALFQWLSEDHRTLLPIISFVGDVFISLGNALLFRINSSTPIFLNALYVILSSEPSNRSVPQSVLHHLFVTILSHTFNDNIARIGQCLHFVVLPLVKEQKLETACGLLLQMHSVATERDGSAHSELLVNSVREIVANCCLPFVVDDASTQRSPAMCRSPMVGDVQNATTIVELCRRYVPQQIVQSTIKGMSKRLPPMLGIRLLHCMVPSATFSAKRNNELVESFHKIYSSVEPSLAYFERILTLSVIGPDFQFELPFSHDHHSEKLNGEPTKSGLWIAALTRRAFVFFDNELSVLFSTRLPILLEAFWGNSLKANEDEILKGLDATLYGCQLGLQASIAAQYISPEQPCSADIALRLCRASCSTLARSLERFPESSPLKCDHVIAATTILLLFLTRKFETNGHEWLGRSCCADIATITLLELLRKYGAELCLAEPKEAKVKISNVVGVIASFSHGEAIRMCQAATSAFQPNSGMT